MPEVTKGVALVLLLGALFTVFTLLLGKLSPEDMALEAEVVAVEKVDEDWREGVLSALACVCDVLEDRAACAEERLL